MLQPKFIASRKGHDELLESLCLHFCGLDSGSLVGVSLAVVRNGFSRLMMRSGCAVVWLMD